MIIQRNLLCFCLLVLACVPRAHAQPSDVFLDLPFAEAVARAEAQGWPIMFYVSVEWAQSERQMRRTTWQDEGLRQLVRSRVSAVYIDADANPDAARELNALAYPTIVLVNPDGERIGRPIVGFRTVEQIRAWMLTNLGERVTQTIRADAPSVTNLPATVLSAINREKNGETDQALEFLAWCWQNVSQLDNATSAARRTFIVRPMARLAARYEPANAEFSELRDTVQSRLESGESSWDDLRDWVVLNHVVGESERSLDWARDRIDEGQLATVRRLEPELVPILLAQRELALLNTIAPDPRDTLDRLIKSVGTMRGSDIEGLNIAVRDYIIDIASDLYAATLAQGREDEAHELAKLIVARVGSPDGTRAGLIRRALEWGQAREAHRDWISRMRDPSMAARVETELEAAL